MTRSATWKQAEREVAARLGGRRVPVTGRGRGDAPDVAHPTLSIEVKHRQDVPAWLLEAMAQAEAASRDGRVPVAVLHEGGRPYDDALCVLRLADLARLLAGGAGPADDLDAGIARLLRGDADLEAWLAGDAGRTAALLADLAAASEERRAALDAWLAGKAATRDALCDEPGAARRGGGG